jgi:hypothetical protein
MPTSALGAARQGYRRKAYMNRGKVRAIAHRRLRRSIGKPAETAGCALVWGHGIRLVLLAAALLGGSWGWGGTNDDLDDDITVTMADCDGGDMPDRLMAQFEGGGGSIMGAAHGRWPAIEVGDAGAGPAPGGANGEGPVGQHCRSNR